MHERMIFAQHGSKDADVELARRRKNEFEIEISKAEVESDATYYNDKYASVVATDGDLVKIRRRKPQWEAFEDKVWRMFYQIHAKVLPVRRTVIEYETGLTQQLDGLYSDENHVYVVECKYRDMKGGQLRKDHSLRGELQQWKGILPEIKSRLQDFPELAGKPVHFLMITRGVDVDGSVRDEGKGWVHFLYDTTVTQITDLGVKMGEGARSVLHQHLFRNTEVPGEPRTVDAIRFRHGTRNVYSFFSSAEQLMDLAYVHRREPSNVDLSTAYQRFVKPEKVAKISDYLGQPGSFFANSIVVSFAKPQFEVFGNPEDSLTWGRLTLPNLYGSVWIIDGQHRLFGSAATSENQRKPFPVIAVEGLSPQEQGELFRTINENQTKIPPDLIWDMYGDLPADREPLTDSEKEGYRNRTISQVWKRLNLSKTHPIGGKIVIPSQTVKSKDCFMQFAYLCDMLNFQELWGEGKLRGDTWTTAENYAYNRLSDYLKGLATHLKERWDEGRDGWLLQQYSMRVLLQIFRYAVIMFSESKYANKWKSHYGELLDEFALELSKAVKKPSIRYGSLVGKAGNAQLRQDMVKKLVKELRESYPTLAPNLDMEVVEATGDEPSAEIYFRTRDLEIRFRDFVFGVLHSVQGENWFARVPEKQRVKIEDDVILRIAHGEDKLSRKPDRAWLDSSTLSDLLFTITDDKNWPHFKTYVGGVKSVFDDYFYDFIMLRNIVMHGKSYPSRTAKQRFLAALEHFEDQQVNYLGVPDILGAEPRAVSPASP